MRTTLRLLGLLSAAAFGTLACDSTTVTPPPDATGSGGQGGQGGQGGAGGAGGQGGGGNGGSGGQGGGVGGSGGIPEFNCDDPIDIGAAPAGPASSSVDLLLVVDNSRGMADKQAVLALSVPTLVARFTNPRCVDDVTGGFASQPVSASDPCPAGSSRELAPVEDLHIGVISSSLGGHGADACTSGHASENDRAHLLDRSDTSGGPPVPSYDDQGFLAWDPNGQLAPPGESDEANLASNLGAMVQGVGEVGCGFEAPLEAMYRFLVEPDPHDTITIDPNSLAAVLEGTDQTVLDQRAAFLRPDSTLVVVLLSDENDCSTRDGGFFYFSNQLLAGGTPYRLPRPRAACATDPNDPCCRSCGQAPGPGCDTSQDQCDAGALPADQDAVSLRCFEQKRRFGIDFVYPIDRYYDGLTADLVADRHGNIVDNPLFVGARDASQIYVTGLVGVPWQDIARRDAAGLPDLNAGLDQDGNAVGGLQDAREREAACTWDLILGDPAAYVDALDPHMVESIEPRVGENPITGDPMAAPGAPADANAINGHEYSIPGNDDLQYACIMPLLTPRDCAIASGPCPCLDPSTDSPLCQNPADDSFGTIQYFTQAYPARRQLALIRRLEHQGIVGSICAPQTSDAGGADYAYDAVADAIAASVGRSIQ